MPSLLGLHVGEYALLRQAAVGAMSEIYEGRHRASGEPVAVKILRPEWRMHAEVVARFLNEAQALQHLRHPNLVGALGSGLLPGEGVPFMILEWLPVDLHQVLAEAGGRLPAEACARVILQLAGALETLHAHRLIHRDLKPANVLLSKRGADAVKLADLGLAKHLVGEGQRPSALPVSTAGSALLGTWDYMAPEQWIQSKTVGPEADVYALGVLWFQMLIGRLPFVSGEEADLMYHHLMKPPPLELLGDFPSAQALVGRMLHKKAPARPTPREIQEALSVAGG